MLGSQVDAVGLGIVEQHLLPISGDQAARATAIPWIRKPKRPRVAAFSQRSERRRASANIRNCLCWFEHGDYLCDNRTTSQSKLCEIRIRQNCAKIALSDHD